MTQLEYAGARWLQFEKNCALVLCERTPRYGHGQPDLIGVTPGRSLYEIEIKRSVADFRANHRKRHILNRTHSEEEIVNKTLKRAPKLFWFLVPEHLAEKVKDEVPDYAGLLMLKESHDITVIKKSPTNPLSERLSIKECAKLLRCAGNMMISMMAMSVNATRYNASDPTFMDKFYSEPRREWKHHQDGWHQVETPSDYVNFQI